MVNTPHKTHINYRFNQSIWYPLYILSFYRMAQAIMLIALAPTPYTFSILGNALPVIYNFSAGLYCIVSLLIFLSVRYNQQGFILQLFLQYSVDLLLLNTLITASGGVTSGINLLLVLSLAVYSSMVPGKTAYLLAAINTIFLFFNEFLVGFIAPNQSPHYYFLALQGVIFFGVTSFTHYMSQRVAESTAIATQRYVALSNLEQLSQLIVNQINNGLIVINTQYRIVLYNQTIIELFQSKPTIKSKLSEFSPQLYERFLEWNDNPTQPSALISLEQSPDALTPEFTHLQFNEPLVLIRLTDTTKAVKLLQAEKLQSLGRLTASIAHEIRNPLSAISHASQLLDESDELSVTDKRFTTIIHNQTQRLNAVVENILQLSRKDKSVPEAVEIISWLEQFKLQFCIETELANNEFNLDSPPDLVCAFDKSQLHQVIWNLCSNSLKYGRNNNDELTIHINCRKLGEFISITVYDEGSGIPENEHKRIFEPFFTSSHNTRGSTGLGLFIAHELCSANNSRLQYHPETHTQSWHFTLLIPEYGSQTDNV